MLAPLLLPLFPRYRGSTFFSRLNALLFLGPPDEHGMATFATMELDSHDNEKIVNMQRISNFLNNVTCGPKSTTLTFTSSDDFTAAVKAWSWVNDHDKHFMHVLANWKGCLTPEGNLQPYHFDNMKSDATSKTITLQGGPQEWSFAAHSFVLEFGGGATGVPDTASDTDTIEGSTSNSSSNATLSKRSQTIDGEASSLNGSTTDLTTNKTNGVSFKDSKWKGLKKHFSHLKGDFVGHKPYDVSIHSDISGKIKAPSIKKAGVAFSAEATCTDCHIFGRMDFDLRAEMKNWKPTELAIYATARGVRAEIGWGIAATVSVGFTCCSHHCRSTTDRFRLFACTIPNLQANLPQTLEIMKPAKLGVKSTLKGHVNEAAQGHMDVLKLTGSNTNFGVTMIPGKPSITGTGKGTVIGHAMAGIGIGASLLSVGECEEPFLIKSSFPTDQSYHHALTIILNLVFQTPYLEYDAVLHMNIPSVGFKFDIALDGKGCGTKLMNQVAVTIQPFIDIFIDFHLGGKGKPDNIDNPIGVTDPKLRKPPSVKLHGRSTKHRSHMLNTDAAEYDAMRAKKVKSLARSAIMSGSAWRKNKSSSTATASRTLFPMGPSGSEFENLDESSASRTDASSFSPSLRQAGDKRWFGSSVKKAAKKAANKAWDWTIYYHKYPIGHLMCFPIGHGLSSEKQDALQASLMNKGRVRVVRRGKGSSLVAPVEVERLSLGPATDGVLALGPTNGTFTPAVQGGGLGVGVVALECCILIWLCFHLHSILL
ncbi:BQ5605_C022g09539 [Microbotryum silenes-dioicae]|uniref:BQ5605_C022g09539 protein n=1 Tax=Microbotryum silenes-dioicae TaxID=796604 RepID=A0A2X0MPP5_9BASI|nr:BQ5605_C022g09539 [Microbotryum silenes-dioicae]